MKEIKIHLTILQQPDQCLFTCGALMEHIAQFVQCMLLSCVSTNVPATYICLPFLGKCHLDKIEAQSCTTENWNKLFHHEREPWSSIGVALFFSFIASDGSIAGAGPIRGDGAMANAGGTAPAAGTTPEGETMGAGKSLFESGSRTSDGPRYSWRLAVPTKQLKAKQLQLA